MDSAKKRKVDKKNGDEEAKKMKLQVVAENKGEEAKVLKPEEGENPVTGESQKTKGENKQKEEPKPDKNSDKTESPDSLHSIEFIFDNVGSLDSSCLEKSAKPAKKGASNGNKNVAIDIRGVAESAPATSIEPPGFIPVRVENLFAPSTTVESRLEAASLALTAQTSSQNDSFFHHVMKGTPPNADLSQYIGLLQKKTPAQTKNKPKPKGNTNGGAAPSSGSAQLMGAVNPGQARNQNGGQNARGSDALSSMLLPTQPTNAPNPNEILAMFNEALGYVQRNPEPPAIARHPILSGDPSRMFSPQNNMQFGMGTAFSPFPFMGLNPFAQMPGRGQQPAPNFAQMLNPFQFTPLSQADIEAILRMQNYPFGNPPRSQ